jgi:ubiquinone/menaquinone biosynthesis C-methylase UbiE
MPGAGYWSRIVPDDRALSKKARQSDAFTGGPYYEMGEGEIDALWQTLIWPAIQDLDFACVLDLAAGEGRVSAKVQQHATGLRRVYVVDINEKCVAACTKRFADDPRFFVVRNSGYDLADIPEGEVTLVVSFDSMVHFDTDVMREYVREFTRILKPGGHAFIHHSNHTANPGASFKDNPHWRNFMSKELFAHWAITSGLEIVSQQVIDWGGEPDLDCLTLLRKPSLKQKVIGLFTGRKS